MKKTAIFLFRRDLRVKFNYALNSLINQEYKIIPLYIYDHSSEEYLPGIATNVWLESALLSLSKSLFDSLNIFSGNTIEILDEIASFTNISKIVVNSVNTPSGDKLYATINKWCNERSIEFKAYKDYLLFEPDNLLKDNGSTYKVFTPFYKKYYENFKFKEEVYNFNEITSIDKDSFIKLESDKFYHDFKYVNSEINCGWDISEAGAEKVFKEFIEKSILNYEKDRDIPSLIGTSRLAPYIHFGQISVRKVWTELQEIQGNNPFLRQLAWRDFAYYTLYNNKDMHLKCINQQYESFPWTFNENIWNKWQSGQTGIPIIDAGMAELRITGYMHNRVRMIIASFLTKNCNIDWRYGQEHFWQNLFDADWANNSFGWQWVAGCGCDAAPYYRIFSPILQSQKFDPRGEYIKKFLPEFDRINIAYIHTPWLLSKKELVKIGIPDIYASPEINLDFSRKVALERHKKYFQDIKMNENGADY